MLAPKFQLQDHRVASGQRGVVLVVSLIMLLLLSIVGITAMQTTQLEEKMAGNQRNLNLAFQAAESALRSGEGWISGRMTRPNPAAALTDYTGCSGSQDVWQLEGLGSFPDVNSKDHQWWQTCGNTFSGSISGVATAPNYIIEEQRFVPDSLVMGTGIPPGRYYYRLTSRGTGGTDLAQAFLQVTYLRRY